MSKKPAQESNADARIFIGFRASPALKTRLNMIATRDRRSVSQVCELLLEESTGLHVIGDLDPAQESVN